MASLEMQQAKALHTASLYVVVQVGREWKFKTPAGVMTRRTKMAAFEAAEAWQKIDRFVVKVISSTECPDCGSTDTEDNGDSEWRCRACDHRWGNDGGVEYGL